MAVGANWRVCHTKWATQIRPLTGQEGDLGVFTDRSTTSPAPPRHRPRDPRDPRDPPRPPTSPWGPRRRPQRQLASVRGRPSHGPGANRCRRRHHRRGPAVWEPMGAAAGPEGSPDGYIFPGPPDTTHPNPFPRHHGNVPGAPQAPPSPSPP
ncbi:hypothetical protein P168DRAFT_245277, partial [Aspergillus campestris IBT 28561]